MDTEDHFKEEYFWCKIKFDIKKLHKVEIYHSPIKIYICDHCLSKMPNFVFQVNPEGASTEGMKK